MDPGDVGSRYVTALRTQSKADIHARTLPCPFPDHRERIFQNIYQLFDHVKAEHGAEIEGVEPRVARSRLKEAALKLRSEQTSAAIAGDSSSLEIAGLTLENVKESRTSPLASNMRFDDSESHVDSEFSRKMPYTVPSDRVKPRSQETRRFKPRYETKSVLSSHQTTGKPSEELLTNIQNLPQSHSQSPGRLASCRLASRQQHLRRQPGLLELQRHDPRYPGLILQPDSRPISQEQLASEVKSIFAGLTMVETKCIHVDRAQAVAALNDSNTKVASDHWQVLIALHRTLLHEHHDFFLASHHPSASPALRQLAAKYSMPARMWKHGIHSFLELLRHRLPDSIEYMLAFICLAYQMMALLYETVPAFEDTWIECLGDLGRYRMAIEDEDIRDRETWAGVARSWYTKAADKNPTIGRLYHHLAILARPNALQQLYYYAKSLTCVKPFPSARDSILTLLDPILSRASATYSGALPIDTNFIKVHALLFRDLSMEEFTSAKHDFIANLVNHIGSVTTSWKEQGIYIAVTNIAGMFQYGKEDNGLVQVFLTEIHDKSMNSPLVVEDTMRTASLADQQEPNPPSIPESALPSKLEELFQKDAFKNARSILNETFAIVLHRIGDNNVLPHVHIMLVYLTIFASNKYVSCLLIDAPWAELVLFLNMLAQKDDQLQTYNQRQIRDINALISVNVFPSVDERREELPLPEDYLVRGLIWAHDYFPTKWFERGYDEEEERYLELASTARSRIERVLRLGFQLAKHNQWIAYEPETYTFLVIP